MNIKGSKVLNVDVKMLWQMLQNEKVLARISPGVSKIEKIEEDRYKAISEINIGPVRGSFEGELALKDKREHEFMSLVLQQKSKIGNAEAKINMTLEVIDAQTAKVVYEGKARVTGRLATMGQRIMGGVINTLTKQVFKELEVIIEEEKGANEVGAANADYKNGHQLEKQGQLEKKKSLFQLILYKILSLWK